MELTDRYQRGGGEEELKEISQRTYTSALAYPWTQITMW